MKTKRKLSKDSGIKTEDGRDVITEITAKEFKQWIKQYGINIDIIARVILNGYIPDKDIFEESEKYKNRTRYVGLVERRLKIRHEGTIPKNEKKWRKFLKNLEKYI